MYQDGRLVGITTGGAYGYAVGRALTFAYVEPKLVQDGAAFEIMVRGAMRRARIIAQPAWDPNNERLRA